VWVLQVDRVAVLLLNPGADPGGELRRGDGEPFVAAAGPAPDGPPLARHQRPRRVDRSVRVLGHPYRPADTGDAHDVAGALGDPVRRPRRGGLAVRGGAGG